MGRVYTSVGRLGQHNVMVDQCESCMQRQGGGLGREAQALKRGPSSPPLNLTVEESMAIFDQPETWSERVQGSAECVREMARRRVRVRSDGDTQWARTAITRTNAWLSDTADQHHSSEA